jgi:hypothetical protein
MNSAITQSPFALLSHPQPRLFTQSSQSAPSPLPLAPSPPAPSPLPLAPSSLPPTPPAPLPLPLAPSSLPPAPPAPSPLPPAPSSLPLAPAAPAPQALPWSYLLNTQAPKFSTPRQYDQTYTNAVVDDFGRATSRYDFLNSRTRGPVPDDYHMQGSDPLPFLSARPINRTPWAVTQAPSQPILPSGPIASTAVDFAPALNDIVDENQPFVTWDRIGMQAQVIPQISMEKLFQQQNRLYSPLPETEQRMQAAGSAFGASSRFGTQNRPGPALMSTDMQPRNYRTNIDMFDGRGHRPNINEFVRMPLTQMSVGAIRT